MIIPTAPTEQLALATVRITARTAKGEESYGSGFFMAFRGKHDVEASAIITNRHVLAGQAEARFIVHGDTGGGTPSSESLSVKLRCSADTVIEHPDPKIDLCAVPLAPVLQVAAALGKEVYFKCLDTSLLPTASELAQLTCVEDILMAGYPNGLWDSYNKMPLMRRGITATHPALDYENRTEFVIDAACFPGSSGSPVFLYNSGIYPSRTGGATLGSRLKLLGVLYAGPRQEAFGEIRVVDIPTALAPISMTALHINLGYVIKSARLLDFERLLCATSHTGGRARPTMRPHHGSPERLCECESGKPFRECHGKLDGNLASPGTDDA